MSEHPERARLPALLSPAGSPEALRAAVERDERVTGIPSTKGAL